MVLTSVMSRRGRVQWSTRLHPRVSIAKTIVLRYDAVRTDSHTYQSEKTCLSATDGP